jgi:predicted Zn finger-like uncharacterized protein
LYTQCSHCETVFQLTAETLRAAGGQVRCGRCGEVFNALARLAEDASAFSSASESALEMEARADEILHSPTPKQPAGAEPASDGDELESGDVEFARLQLIEKFKPSRHEASAPPRHVAPPVTVPAAPPRSPAPKPKPVSAAGTAGTPGTASTTENGKRAARDAAPAAAPVPSPLPAAAAPRAGAPQEPVDDGALEFTLPPGELDRVFVDPGMARARPSILAESAAASERPADESAEPAGEHMQGLDVAEHVRRDMLSGLRQRQFDEPSEPSNPAMRLVWGAAAAALTLALLAQMIHENRAWLAAHGPLRGPLQSFYGALGVKVQPPVNLSAYQLRQWGVTGDPNAAGTLRLRASILNTSAQLQPYPLLRVTLANRFGTHVGARDFEPAEYLGRPMARLMTPGERADATLDIQDPGKDAEGFEIDVCLRAEQAVSCAADAAAQTGAPQAGAPGGPQTGAPRTKP